MKKTAALSLILLLPLAALASELIELDEEKFRSLGKEKSIVVLQVNWGRVWGCADFDNAQLTELAFRQLPGVDSAADSQPLILETPSRLSPEDRFQSYALIIEPGYYVLSGFRVSVARSMTDVGYVTATEDQLIEDGKPIGGSFRVGQGEIVYLGHIALDCSYEPIPWRFYIEGRDEFTRYAEEFASKHPYLSGNQLLFRLIETTAFGQPYSLGESYGVQM
jgi:hypothetical protein